MNAVRAQQIESTVVVGASACLAAAVAFAGVVLGGAVSTLPPVSVSALATACAILAFVGSRHTLGAIDCAAAAYPLRPFDVVSIDPSPALEADELVLADADRLSPQPLELDDVLAQLPPGSRVVRLFDPGSMPTPGELGARIDHHLGGSPADASLDLLDALAELRRSLR